MAPRLILSAVAFFVFFVFFNQVAGADDKVDDEPVAKIERQTFALINAYRAENHFPELKWDDAIAGAARAHSRDMASGDVDFGHDGFSQRVGNLKSVITSVRGAAENVFMTDNPDQLAQMAVATWLKSPHHLENIRGDYTLSGIGLAQNSRGQIYFTQLFLRVEKEASPATP